MKMPAGIVPMAAEPGYMPFNDPNWCFEIKLDGYRMIAYVDHGTVKLQTRNGKDYTSKFPSIVAALKKWKHAAILDGEVVVLNDDGISDFDMLQNWKSDDDGPIYYFAFDLLWLNGKDFMQQPLYRRKNALKNLLPRSLVVIYHDEIVTWGKPCFDMAKKAGMEGIVAKKIESAYKPGTRSNNWLKLKATREEDFIICGYTKMQGSGMPFSSLILGAWHEGQLQYVGEVGTGFTNRLMKELLAKLKPVKRCPFKEEPYIGKTRWRKQKPDTVVWCKPQWVCSVKFLEWTKAGQLRHQSFRCLREDKKPEEVVM